MRLDKKQVFIALALILSFALGKVLLSPSSKPSAQKKQYLDDDTKMKLFTENDLYKNKNFSNDIDRLRTVDFKNTPKKKPKVSSKLAQNDSKKKKKKKLKRAKKKNLKKKKKKGLEEEKAEEEEVAEEEVLDEEEFKEEDEQLAADGYVIQEQGPQSTNDWVNLLLNDPSDINFDLFYEAYKSGEINEANFYSTLRELIASRQKLPVKKSLEIASEITSAQSFILISTELASSDSPLSSREKKAFYQVQTAYTSSDKGLKALRSVIYYVEEDDAMKQSAILLTEAAVRDLSSGSSTSNSRTRVADSSLTNSDSSSRSRDESLSQDSDDSNNLSFYISLYRVIQSQSSNFVNNADYVSDWATLSSYLSQNLDLSIESESGRSRVASF
ncbi:MAG: hypothetical protein VX642_07065 [Bdellovibrionota bacterium]|nr:hypothetical protein [Bdellovibrionota bacterium]